MSDAPALHLNANAMNSLSKPLIVRDHHHDPALFDLLHDYIDQSVG